jgi:hypothetical protein
MIGGAFALSVGSVGLLAGQGFLSAAGAGAFQAIATGSGVVVLVVLVLAALGFEA